MFRPSRLKLSSSLPSPWSSWVLNAMQLLQYGNLTPQNVVCCGPCDDPEHNLQQECLKKKTDSGNSQTIPFTRSLGHFRISLTGLLGE